MNGKRKEWRISQPDAVSKKEIIEQLKNGVHFGFLIFSESRDITSVPPPLGAPWLARLRIANISDFSFHNINYYATDHKSNMIASGESTMIYPSDFIDFNIASRINIPKSINIRLTYNDGYQERRLKDIVLSKDFLPPLKEKT